MKFREFLNKEKVLMSLEYYGIDDIATGWEIAKLLEKQDTIINFINEYEIRSTNNVDDYLYYLFLKKIICYEELLDKIAVEENKKNLQDIINSSKTALSNFSYPSLIQFFNAKYKELFEQDYVPFSVNKISVDLILKYNKGINDEVFKYIAQNNSYLIIHNFNDFEKIIENQPDLIEYCLKNGDLETAKRLGLNRVFDLFIYGLNKKSPKLKKQITRLWKNLYDAIVDECESCTLENSLIVNNDAEALMSFLKSINSSKANSFDKLYEKVNSLLKEHLEKFGKKITYQIPVKDTLEKLAKIKKWEIRFTSLTHRIYKDDNQVVIKSYLDIVPDKKELIDQVSSNIKTDSYFTYSFQQHLLIVENTNLANFSGIINNDDFFEDLSNMILWVCEYLNNKLVNFEENLLPNIKNILRQLNIMRIVFKKDQDNAHCFNYGITMSLCAYIESLLRGFYKYLVREKCYVDDSFCSLGKLLNDDNTDIINIFGENRVKNLLFILSTVGEEKIGHNIRNELAHLSRCNMNKISILDISKLLWLLCDILTTIFWYFLDNDHDTNGDE